MESRSSWSAKSGEERDDQSLITILKTPQERRDFTLLVASCMESMRKGITDVFDATQTGKAPGSANDLTGDDAIRNPNLDLSAVDVEALDKEKKAKLQREKELSTPKMRELKEAALKFFDEWRDAVLQRVGEVVNSREIAIAQKKQATPTLPRANSRRLSPSPDKYDEGVTTALAQLYPPVSTALAQLPEERRAVLVHSMLLLLLSLEHYLAHSRVLMLYLISSLGLSIGFLTHDEAKVARGLLEAASQMSADDETKKRAEQNVASKKWKVGLASVAGAALVGVTGGLAAPLLAAGVGSVMGGLGLASTAAAGYLGAMAGSSVLVGGLFGAYGGRMTGQMMEHYAKEVEDFGFVPVRPYSRPRKIEKEYRRLRIAIGISGWLTEGEEIVKPWRVLGTGIEAFALRWELEVLLNLGNSITTMVKSAAWGYAQSEIIKRTVFSSLAAGLWPLGLLKVAKVIDNPFSVAKARSEKAGEVLADAIINKAQGERPVTLVGYSLGARVIYTCLLTLAERKAFGLIESVVLIGAPTSSTAAEWRRMRSVVSGRLINVYSTNDPILAFVYRTSSIQYGVAGLERVDGVKGVENIDVSDLVKGHTQYRFLTGSILKKIGFEDVDLLEVAREEDAMRVAEETETRERDEKKRTVKATDAEQEAEDMQKEVEQKNHETMMAWATEKLRVSSSSAAAAASPFFKSMPSMGSKGSATGANEK